MTTEDERDDKVSARYRELGADAPPARLDDAILAASRRAVHARPGVPVTKGVRRWAVPFSVAAAVVLSVMVTVHVQEERPDLASPPPATLPAPKIEASTMEKKDVLPAAPAAPVAREAPKAAARSAPAPVITPGVTPDVTPGSLGASADTAKAPAAREDAPRSVRREAARPQPGFAEDPRPAAAGPAPATATTALPAAPAAAPAPTPAAAPARPRPLADQNVAGASLPAPAESRQQGELARDRVAAESEDAMAKRAIAQESPERLLERIATLRAEGRHVEADKLLAEFRQRHPAYRIPEAMLERVQPPRPGR